MRRLPVLAAMAALLLACDGGPEPTDATDAPPPRDEAPDEQADEAGTASDACVEVFAEAEAAGGDLAVLDGALTACEDIAAVRDAASQHPDALGDLTPEVWAADACGDQADQADAPLCQDIAGN
jgi:hypothetical protein